MIEGLVHGSGLVCIPLPLEDLDETRALVLSVADDLGLEVKTEDRIGNLGLVHLDVWRADGPRPEGSIEAAPPR
jgi:hypothetical protein